MSKLEKEARRRRCGIIGSLEACTCTYPIKVARNTTGHPKSCPAFHIIRSQESAAEARA